MNSRLFLLALALFIPAVHAADTKRPLRVFILAGQSNMEGKAKVSLMDYQVKQPATAPLFTPFQKDGKWAERDDVWIKFLDRKGPLTTGFGSPGCIGPELQFGWTVGDKCSDPVLLIKTAWGGRSLWRDFRPPSAGLPADAALQKMLTDSQKKKPETTLDDIKKPFGASYRDMIAEVNKTLTETGTLFPALAGCEPQLSGLVWFQGWNDMVNAEYTAEYATNLTCLIRDVRKDLKTPALPFVVAQMGVDGTTPNEATKRFKDAQAKGSELPEFKGNVFLVKTDVFWDDEAAAVYKKGWRQNIDEWNKVGSDFPFHYLGSARTHCGIGKACAEALGYR